MRITFIAAALAAATVPFLPAQAKLVSPAALTNTGGSIFNSIPWGPFVPTGNTLGECFHQQIYDDLKGTPRLFKGFAYRHLYTSNYVSKTYDVKITLADAATSGSGISTTFANNFKTGGNKTVVYDGKVTFPALPAVPRPPAPFAAIVTFTTPHAHAGTDSLLCEILVRSTTPVTPTHFFERGPTTSHTAGVVGVGCIRTGGTVALNATGSATTTTISNALANGPLSAPASLWIGDTGSMWGPYTLPLDLVLVGSPGCFVNINLILPVTTLMTSAAGSASAAFPYVQTPFTSGVRFRTQWVALDGTTVRTSNGLDHSTPHTAGGVPWPQWRVYANGFGATPPTSGSSLGNQGLVTEWHY